MGKRLYAAPELINVQANSPEGILFISDLHLRRQHTEALDNMLTAVRGLTPGVVLLGGDMAEYDEGLELAYGRIRAAFPNAFMAAVAGNNENHLFDGDFEVQRGILAKYGCQLLRNECAKYKNMEIAGVDEPVMHKASAKRLFSKKKGVYRVLLSHSPLKRLLTECRPDLMLSGHTHGGQINVLGVTVYMLLSYEHEYAFTHFEGIRQLGSTLSVVSRGVGYSKWPIRVGANPEIHYIK